MRLGRKLHAMTALFTILAIIFVSLLFYLISSRSNYEVEEMTYIQTMASLKGTIEKEFDDLEYILTDWAEWDATYEFVQGNRLNYIKDNFGEDILADLDLDYFYIVDEHQNALYAYQKKDDAESLEPITTKDMEVFDANESETGILLIDNKLVLFASMKVTNNEATAKPLGAMGFGRILDDDHIEILQERTHLVLKVNFDEHEPDKIDSYVKGKYDIVGELIHNKDKDSVINIRIPIINNESDVVIETLLQNTVQDLGKKYVKTAMLVVFLLIGLFGMAIDFAFRRFVLNRLILLNDQISSIRNTRSTKERLGSHGIDEIGELSVNINSLLEEIDDMHQEVSYYATYDEMTGVYNRRVGFDILEECIKSSNESDIPFSIVYIDIDGLKKVNDNFGHQIGDQLINDTVQVIQKVGTRTKYIVRIGGDEFLIILKNSDKIEAEVFEEQVRRAMVRFNESSDRIYSLSFSYGSVQYEQGISLETLLEMADKLMYEKKQQVKKEL